MRSLRDATVRKSPCRCDGPQQRWAKHQSSRPWRAVSQVGSLKGVEQGGPRPPLNIWNNENKRLLQTGVLGPPCLDRHT